MQGQSLESELKPDWKQWLPIYGIVQVNLDGRQNKPVIITHSPLYYHGSALYHGIAISLLSFAVLDLAKRLF